MKSFHKIHITSKGEMKRLDKHWFKNMLPGYGRTDWREWYEPLAI